MKTAPQRPKNGIHNYKPMHIMMTKVYLTQETDINTNVHISCVETERTDMLATAILE